MPQVEYGSIAQYFRVYDGGPDDDQQPWGGGSMKETHFVHQNLVWGWRKCFLCQIEVTTPNVHKEKSSF